MFCGVCGRTNIDGAQYCEACGAQLARGPANPPMPPAPGPAAAPAPARIPGPPAAPMPPPAPAPTVQMPPFPAAGPPPVGMRPPAPEPNLQMPPPPPVPGVAPGAAAPLNMVAGYRVAGLGDRLIAVILDAIFLAAVYAVIGMAVATRMGGLTDSGFSLTGLPALLAIGGTLLVGFLYYWVCEGAAGATLGKGIAGIQVRAKTGGPCGMGSSLVRNLLRIIDAIAVYLVGFLIAVFSKFRQRLGDHAAGTVVVENPAGGAARAALVLVWLATLGGGLFGAYTLHKAAPESVAIDGPFVALPSTVPMSTTGRLRAGNFDFLQSKGGPARPAAPYRPGDDVYIKYDVIGFARDAQDRPNLSFALTVLDPNGLSLHEPWTPRFNGPIEKRTPVNGSLSFELPVFAPAGAYKINIKVHDEVKNTDLELTPSFQVNAPAVSPPNGLEVRDLELSLSKDGPAEAQPALEGGGTVYMKCNVFGMQFQGDRISGAMALKLLGPDGKVLLDQPNYVDLTASSVYHPAMFWLPVTGRVSVPAGFAKGIYTEQYTVVDNFANKTITQEAKFEVK